MANLTQWEQKIILREWRHAQEDGYAEALLEQVVSYPVGLGSLVPLVLIGAVYFGPLIGITAGIIQKNWNVISEPTQWKFDWEELQTDIKNGILCGAGSGLLAWVLFGRGCYWGRWVLLLLGENFFQNLLSILLAALIGGIGWAFLALGADWLFGQWRGNLFISTLSGLAGASLGAVVGAFLAAGRFENLSKAPRKTPVAPPQRILRLDLQSAPEILLLLSRFASRARRIDNGWVITLDAEELERDPLLNLFLQRLRERALPSTSMGHMGNSEPPSANSDPESEAILLLLVGCIMGVVASGVIGAMLGLEFRFLGSPCVGGLVGALLGGCGGFGMYKSERSFSTLLLGEGLIGVLVGGIIGGIISGLLTIGPPTGLLLALSMAVGLLIWKVTWVKENPRAWARIPLSVRRFSFWSKGRPLLLQLQKVLQKTSGPFPELFRQVEQSARVEEIPRLVAWLSGEDWRQRFVARHALVRIGGACIIRLEELAKEADRPLRKEIRRILEAISQETEARLSKAVHRVLCSHDQCWLSKFRISVARVGSFRFYGCRQCYQTQQFTPHSGPIGAVLDKKMRREAETRDGQLRINWLRRQKRTRALFDFDWIEIIRSPDIEVHRFCMDVHGDMDPVRRRRYKKMLCRVCSGVDLCPNTWQLLRHTFGRVETVAEPGQCR